MFITASPAWQSNEVIDFLPADQFDSYQTEHTDNVLFRGFLNAFVLRCLRSTV